MEPVNIMMKATNAIMKFPNVIMKFVKVFKGRPKEIGKFFNAPMKSLREGKEGTRTKKKKKKNNNNINH